MNPETNEFVKETGSKSLPKEWPRFSVGQTFSINGTLMKIRKVTKKDIIMRPVKKEKESKD